MGSKADAFGNLIAAALSSPSVGHPLFSYLPDGDLIGLTLDFDVTWQGIQSWESLKSTF